MRNQLLTPTTAGIFLAAFSLFTACSNNGAPAVPTDTMAASDSPAVYLVTTMDTVPLEEALEDIKHYQDSCALFFHDTVPIRAYTIHASDMLLAMGIDPSTVKCPFTHARVYIGMNDNNHFKLFFTPVVGASMNKGVLNPGRDTILRNEDGARYVMDLNAPCPNTCDSNSPLYDPQ